MQQWVDWEEVSERVTGWLKDVDVELRRVDLKPTVEEKLATLQHLRVSTAPSRWPPCNILLLRSSVPRTPSAILLWCVFFLRLSATSNTKSETFAKH